MSEQRLDQILAMLTGFATEYGLKVIGAIVILFVGYTVAKLASKAVGKALQKSRLDSSLVKFLTGLVRFGIIIFTWIAALETFGVETTSFVAVLGAAGLAVGLALQGSLSNFAAGVMILFLKPFSEGDYIQVSGAEGEVEEIGILTTVLNTLDNLRVIIPNSTVFGNTIVNFTGNPRRRVDVAVGISYSSDINQARATVIEAVKRNPMVLSEPAPRVEVLAFGDSSVNLTVRSWVKPSDYWPTFFALNQTVKESLDAAGITIPFPQRDVHLINASDS